MNPRKAVAEQMAVAAQQLLDGLTAEQRERLTFAFPEPAERELWFYTPTDHGGLSLAEMTSPQHRLVHQLMATGLSTAGYVTAAAIMGLENVLDHSEGWTAGFDRPRGRDPLLYWVSIFGEPGTDAWGWRFGGHHISLHFTVIDGEVMGTTPCFFGADPAAAPLLGPLPHRPLAGVEDLARELVHSFDDEQRHLALVSPVAPTDLVGANRTELAHGDRTIPLELIWRGRFEAELDQRMAEVHRSAEAALGVTDEVHERLSFTHRPKGLPVGRFRPSQGENLVALLAAYVERIPDDLADQEMARLTGSLDDLAFLWAGGIEAGQPHYYRVQGGRLFVEYDNTQRDVNHVHSVWRDLRNDFGRDALAAHYAHHEH
jgi:hypothetical protein